MLLVALGIDVEGKKHVLGRRDGHLIRAVQCRTKDHRKHQLPHEPLGDHTDQSKYASEGSTRVASDLRHAENHIYSKEVGQICEHAGSDKPVHRIIDAFDAGARTKIEILDHAEMKARIYSNASLITKIEGNARAPQRSPHCPRRSPRPSRGVLVAVLGRSEFHARSLAGGLQIWKISGAEFR